MEDIDIHHNLTQHLPALQALQAEMVAKDGGDNPLSYIYGIRGIALVAQVQESTRRIMAVLAAVAPGRRPSTWIERIMSEGSDSRRINLHSEPSTHHSFGVRFEQTFCQMRPIAEAYLHARYLLDQAIMCASGVSPETSEPSCWRAVRMLYSNGA